MREKAWKIREALTGRSRLRDLTLFSTQILYNKPILIQRVQKQAPNPVPHHKRKLLLVLVLFSSDQRLVSNTSECESLLKPSLLSIATFTHPWLSFVHIFKNWYQWKCSLYCLFLTLYLLTFWNVRSTLKHCSLREVCPPPSGCFVFSPQRTCPWSFCLYT